MDLKNNVQPGLGGTTGPPIRGKEMGVLGHEGAKGKNDGVSTKGSSISLGQGNTRRP